MSMILVFIGAAFINNFVLTQFLGMCPFLGVSKKTETAIGMGLAVIFVMTVSSVVTFLFFNYVLVPFDLQYLQTIVFILTIASLVQVIESVMKKMFPPLYDSLGIFLPLMTTNCAIIGVALINIRDAFTFLDAVANSLGAGFGFLLALVLLSGMREKYEHDLDIPIVFRGLPLALFSAGLMSIAFMGFSGLVIGR
ncbi:MAG: RnfABCDGE type electron transport complex subunit A [Spirochaetes bacterium]|nr:RnfABCDGE type electron transport complex subunit A [Spirochaetota bacterium]